jgi:8-oxo-dGTP pyrophosphatase MutT (NUDIX family)
LNAAGVWFYSLDTKRYLYLLRRDKKYNNTWGLPGGKAEVGETLLMTIERECEEELGSMPDYVKLVPLEQFTSPDESFVFHTFFCCVLHEFTPVLNDEHWGYAWIDAGNWPRPMHPGLWNTVNFDAVQQKIETVKRTIISA